jgi:hypothetical protein
MKSTQDIIKESDEVKEMGMDWKRVYAAVALSIQNNTHRVMRSGNTLLWIKLLPQKTAQMYVFNADTQKNFLKNMKEFAKALDKSGFESVFGETHNMQLIEMMKRLGYPVKVEQVGTDDQGRTIYRGTVDV